jgi:hypothetical protein
VRTPELKRLIWAGPLTVLASCLVVLSIRAAAAAILKPDPGFLPLTLKPPIIDTVWGAGAAVLVFHAMCRDTPDPVNKYRALAAKLWLFRFCPTFGWPFSMGMAAGGLKHPHWPPCISQCGLFVSRCYPGLL